MRNNIFTKNIFLPFFLFAILIYFPIKVFATEETGCCIKTTREQRLYGDSNCINNSTRDDCYGKTENEKLKSERVNGTMFTRGKSCSDLSSFNFFCKQKIGCCVKDIQDTNSYGPANCLSNATWDDCLGSRANAHIQFYGVEPDCANIMNGKISLISEGEQAQLKIYCTQKTTDTSTTEKDSAKAENNLCISKYKGTCLPSPTIIEEGAIIDTPCDLKSQKVIEGAGCARDHSCCAPSSEQNNIVPVQANSDTIPANGSSGNSDGSNGSSSSSDTTSVKDCDMSLSEGASGGGFLGFKGSIVPCGRQCDDTQTSIKENENCTLCHLLIMGKRIYEFVLALLVPVAILFITIGGLIYMLSGPSITDATTGKKIITNTLIGFGLFLLGWLIIFTLLKFLAVNNTLIGTGGKWYEFSCDTNSAFK